MIALKSNPWLFLFLDLRQMCYCAMLSVHCLFAGGFPNLKCTPNVFSIVAKLDLSWKCLLFTNAEEQNIASYGNQHLMTVSWMPKNKSLWASSFQKILCSKNTSPNAQFLLKSSLAFFQPTPLLDIGWMSHWVSQCLLFSGHLRGVSVAWNST